jgi:hypothetical protein
MPEAMIETPTDTTQTTMIPDKKAAPKPGKLPEHYGKIYNLAEDAVLAESVRSWAAANFLRFDVQSQREEYVKDGGVADMNDRMWRVALNQDSTNSQTKETLSDVTSPVFRVAVRAITAAETAIMFSDDRLPAEFEPEINTSEYTLEDGRTVAEYQNALEQLIWDEDKRTEKVKELVEYVNKDGMRVALLEWCREERDVTELVPDIAKGKNENGTWVSVKPVTKKRVVKDWPTLTTDEIEHWWFDAAIPELCDQRCVLQKSRTTIEKLYAMQAAGKISNVGEITASQLFMGEVEGDVPLKQRQENAGEDREMEATGEIEIWRVWGWMPIGERTTPKRGTRKGKWRPKDNVPGWYEAMFAGHINSGTSVCLKLCKLPHWHGKIPAKIIRSHRDNKGAFSVGFGQMMKSLYWQACTNLNQAIDNTTERNWPFLIQKGQCYTRDLTYRKNKVVKLSVNGSLDHIEIPDTTRITMEMYRIIREMIDELIGANKPIRGESFGARTSASEAVTTTQFASQPLDEMAAYIMDQIFPWMYELDAAYMRQYGDPNTILRVTHNTKDYEIYPTTLWGPIKTKVTAMARFKRSTIEKQGLAQFLQNVMPMFIDAMGPQGKKVLGREALRIMNVPKANEIFPTTDDVEASAVANRTIQEILILGGWVEPQPGENHAAQLTVLRSALREFAALPEGDRPEKDNFDRLRAHIQIREDMMEQEQARAQSPAEAATEQPQFEGQATGAALPTAQAGEAL